MPRINFNVQGGTISGSTYKDVSEGSAIGNLPTATKEGYGFGGWFTGDDGHSGMEFVSSTIYPDNLNRTLYAKWTFEDKWFSPKDEINNGGRKWNEIVDGLSTDDMNKIVANLQWLKTHMGGSSGDTPIIFADLDTLTNKVTNTYYMHTGSNNTNYTIGVIYFWDGNKYYVIDGKPQYSNPNLLINGDFQVNQRGQDSYTGYTSYTVDRWKNSGTNIIINNDKTITINFISGWNYFYQMIEDFEKFRGKTLTLSVKFKNISYTNGSPKIAFRDDVKSSVSDIIPNGFSGIYTVTGTVSENATYLHVRALYNSQSGTSDINATIEWAKLEVSSVATQFSPRPYAEELAMCQRYFIELNVNSAINSPIGNGFCNRADAALINAPLPTTMRTRPTLIHNSLYLRTVNGGDVTSLNIDNFSGNMITFWVDKETSTNMVVGNAVFLRTNDTLPFSLDAEIY